VYISPDVLRFKRNDFGAAHEIVEVAYAAARTSLGEWLARTPEERDRPRADSSSLAPSTSVP
jgi:hypothetical protein